jgi:predicted lipid-binding transport protein (Tim44 family)
MKKLLMAVVVTLSALMVVAPQAEAKRMGGGGSFGKQSQTYQRAAPSQSSSPTSAAKPAAAPNAAPAGAAAAAKPSMWKGMLGGALLGLGLGALLSHFGIGGAFASMISTILMIALFAFVAMWLYRMFRNKSAGNNGGAMREPAFANSYSDNAADQYSARTVTPEIGSRIEPVALPSATSGSDAFGAHPQTAMGNELPPDFDVQGFIRNAKTYFIRLQAAWDKGDIDDIREFTTPEMFAELRLQLQERGATPNVTDVVSLDGVFYGVETVGNDYIASIKFTGMIKEAANAPVEPFSEAWNLSKPVNGNGGWVLAGIQQLS